MQNEYKLLTYNIMRINQLLLSALLALCGIGTATAQNVVQTMYLDFGVNDIESRGHTTNGADANGHYWTNVKTPEGNYVYPGTSFDIVNSKNASTGYSVFVNTRFMSNGRTGGGGLLAPKAELLGDLAVETATEDYIFVESFQNFNFISS